MECDNCGGRLHETCDPGVPWVHDASGNCYCDVDSPGEAVFFAELNPTGIRLEAVPVFFGEAA